MLYECDIVFKDGWDVRLWGCIGLVRNGGQGSCLDGNLPRETCSQRRRLVNMSFHIHHLKNIMSFHMV